MNDLKILVLDAEKGTLFVNGIEFSNVDKFSLVFSNGAFELNISQRYFADGKKISRPNNETADE